MAYMIDHPRLLCLASAAVMWLMAALGVWLRSRTRPTGEDRDSFGYVVSATLTLLGLIISFTFSMAATRYDQRRLFEEEEANAIGTEIVRVELLPPASAQALTRLLRVYLDRRIDFYQLDYGPTLSAADARTAQLQAQLWQGVLASAAAQPTPITALAVAGMNDVLNRQGYTQFAWWNRIPSSAWALTIIIALFANALVGFADKRARYANLMLLVLPLIASVSFLLVADIDSPRGGFIRIQPRDLQALSQSLGQAGR